MLEVSRVEKMNWHFITFAFGEGFVKSANRLQKEADQSGFFNSTRIFSRTDLINDSEFWASCGDFLDNQRNGKGYGMWLWKPRIIMKTLSDLGVGDGILYMDAGCHLNLKSADSRFRMSEYLEIASSCNSLAFEVSNQAKELFFTHPQIFQDMNVPKRHQESPQIEASSLFLVNTIENQTFLTNWLYWMMRDDFKYLLNQDFLLKGKAYFGRYDQSIMSCLYKLASMEHLPNETYFHPHWSKHGKAFPIWHIRNRAGGRIMKSWISIQFESFVKRLFGFIKSKLGS